MGLRHMHIDAHTYRLDSLAVTHWPCQARHCKATDLCALLLQGLDWNGQLKFGSNEFYGECRCHLVAQQCTSQFKTWPCQMCPCSSLWCATMQPVPLPAGINYLQSVTPRLALGGEAFWLGQQRKSGTGFAGRFTGDAFVATAQVATTGLVSLTYVQKISEKVRSRARCLHPERIGCH